jgi:uncharacterized protein
MKLTIFDIQNILSGATFLGTGGGGRYDVAKKLAQDINAVEIQDIDLIKNTDLFITIFGIGGLKKKGKVEEVNKRNLDILSEILNQKPKYLIPVEIGPVSVMNVLKTASLLKLPVLDGDLVGCRAAPEIYLEAITLRNVNRLPIVASNSEGETIILDKTSSIENIETVLRDFSERSRSKVYVAGYPLYKDMIVDCMGKNSITYTLKVGEIMNKSTTLPYLIKSLKTLDINFVDQGIITAQEEFNCTGFTAGKLTIKTKFDTYEIFYKNEFLVLLKNNNIYATCPDSILVLDENQRIGLNNSDDNVQKRVSIFSKKAIDIWRTNKGKALFSPEKLGFPYKQKLL